MKRRVVTRGRVLMALGLLLILGAGGLLGYNRYIDNEAGKASDETAAKLIEEIAEEKLTIYSMRTREKPKRASSVPAYEDDLGMIRIAELDGAYYMGVLTIPTLDRELPVQSGWSMKALRTSPCRYSGSLNDGGLVICAHNYDRHFGGIGNLAIDDLIYFTDLSGHQWHFKVVEILTMQPTQIEEMIDLSYDLTLFTCTYGGRSRVTVRCMKTA